MRTQPLALSLLLALAPAARAEFPLGSMGPRDLGIQYGLAFRGQDITARDIPSHEIIHAFTLGYAPIPYLGFEAGLGLDRFEVDPYQSTRFRGDYGIAPIIGVSLASPWLLEFARLTAGMRALGLNSEDAEGFAYSGFVYNPWISAAIAPSPYAEFQLGVRGHSIDGTMGSPDSDDKPFSNRETFRGFVSFSLKSPGDKAFLTFDLDFSPAVDSDWSNGPRESSIGIAFGTLLSWNAKREDPEASPPYFPAYREMKDKQDEMAEETK